MRRFLLPLLAILVIAGPARPQAAPRDAEGYALPAEVVARVGSMRLRHQGAVRGLAYAFDGKRIISIGEDDTIRIWDADTGKLAGTTEAKIGWDQLQALRMDGKTVDVLAKGVLWSFDPFAGKTLRKIAVSDDHFPPLGCFSPDGTLVAYGVDAYARVHVHDVATGKEKSRHQFANSHFARWLAFTPDGKQLAVFASGPAPGVRFLDSATGQAIAGRELPVALRVFFAPDGRCLLDDSFWDLKTAKRIATLQREKNARAFATVAFSPDSRYVAVPGWSDVALHETATGKELRRLPTGPEAAWRLAMPYVPSPHPDSRPLAFSPDGKRLVVGNRDGQISQWDVETGELMRAADPPTGSIRAQRFLDGSRLLAETDHLVLYEWKTGKLVRQYPGEAYAYTRAVPRLSPDGKLLAFLVKEATIELREASSGKSVRTLPVLPNAYNCVLAFAPDGRRLYSSVGAGVPSIRAWDLATGKMLYEIDGVSGQFGGSRSEIAYEYLAVSPDSRLFATAASQPTMEPGEWPHWLRVWDAENGKLIYKCPFRQPLTQHVAFAPAGGLLVVLRPDAGKDQVLTLIEPTTGTRRWTQSLERTIATSAAFSSDGHNLAIGTSDGSLRLYEAATGRQRYAFRGHRREVDGVAFTPDGALLAASSFDAPVFVWDVYGRQAEHPPLPKWSAEDTTRHWKDLAGADAETAFSTVRRLVRNPDAAVAFLRERLAPAAPIRDKHFQHLLRQLDSDEFEMRQKAYNELEQLAEELEFRIREEVKRRHPLEVKRRLETLLMELDKRLDPKAPERLRRWRVLETLEQIATREALQLRQELSAGARSAR
jgi:WD40 repeat protein